MSELNQSTLRPVLERALEAGRAEAPYGQCADYIPELSRVDSTLVGIAVHTVAGLSLHVGAADTSFTLQSVSKVFALAQVLSSGAGDLFKLVSLEPSGDAFHSIVRLEEETGRPRNPLINAGAIVVSERLPGSDADGKAASLRDFLEGLCGQTPGFDERVYLSESATGSRNRALAYYMHHHGVVDSPDVAVDTYFRQCSTTATARTLATMGLFLANEGLDPRSPPPHCVGRRQPNASGLDEHVWSVR